MKSPPKDQGFALYCWLCDCGKKCSWTLLQCYSTLVVIIYFPDKFCVFLEYRNYLVVYYTRLYEHTIRLLLSDTVSAPAVPLLSPCQVQSPWLCCPPPTRRSAAEILSLRACSCSLSFHTGTRAALLFIKVQSCLTGWPEGNQFTGTKVGRCCCTMQVTLVSSAPEVKRLGFLLQRLCFTHW